MSIEQLKEKIDFYTTNNVTAIPVSRLFEAWQMLPKLLAFVDAFDRMAGWQDIAAEITKEVFLARAALDDEETTK